MLKEALSRMADVFLPAVLMRGQEYQQKGYVLNIRLSDGLLKARVKGNSSRIYDVHIDLKSWPATVARCSCPYSINCKHAAASLFALQIRENYPIPAPVSSTSNRSLNTWLAALREKGADENKASASHEIAYLLQPQYGDPDDRVTIRLALAKRLKKGGLGKKVVFNTMTDSRKQYFNGNDEEIIATLLLKNGSRPWFDYFSVRNSDLLEKILASNRAYLADNGEPPLSLGEALPAHLGWQLSTSGGQFLVLESEYGGILPLLIDQPWYFDQQKNHLGQLNIAYSSGQLKLLLHAPAIELDQVPFVAQQLAETNPELPPPHVFAQRIVHKNQPHTCDYF